MLEKSRLNEPYTRAWERARDALGIRVVAPFTWRGARGDMVFAAYLPDWGGAAGILLEAAEASVAEAATIAAEVREGGYSWSRLSPVYRAFDPAVFREALDDWGYHGPPGGAPAWYGKRWFDD